MRFINKRKDKNAENSEIKNEIKERMFLANKRNNISNTNLNNSKNMGFRNKNFDNNHANENKSREKSKNKFFSKKSDNNLSLRE